MSTLILANKALEQSTQNVVVSYDRSLASIACTASLLKRYGVEYQIMSSHDAPTAIENANGCVVLVYDEEGFLDGLGALEGEVFDGVYSNHGDAYADLEYRTELLAHVLDVCKVGATYVSDNLNQEYSLSFDKLWVMWQMTLGRPLSKSGLRQQSDFMRTKQHEGETHITHMLDRFSIPILDLGNYYILHDLESFRLLLNCLELSTLWQRRLISAVHSPASLIDRDILHSVGELSSQGKRFVHCEKQPVVPVYISSLALNIK